MQTSVTRRDLIETTALRLFAERGYAEVSVRDIAQACEIGESALYRHMSSKEELAIRVFRKAYLGFGEQMLTASRTATSLEAHLSAYLTVMLEGFDRDPLLIRFLLIRQHDTLARAITPEDRTPLTILRDAITQASAAGEILVDDPDMMTAMVLGAALQPMTFMLFGRIPSPAISHHSDILSGLKRLLGLS